MKEFEQSCFRGSILVEMGDGNLEKGIKTGHNKGKIDELSAAIILQEYLDSK